MVEAGEIQIMITAVDNMTATLKQIEGTLQDGNTKIIKTTEETTASFQDQVSSLLAVGNMVESVEGVWRSYENQQLRLENANERLANSQDRLSDAQYNLSKVMQDSNSTMEDVAHAQDQVERASRELTITQNNLQRAQNMVIGTYITMGVEVIRLINSLPQLIKIYNSAKDAIVAWAESEVVLEAITNPLYLAVGLAAAAAGIMATNALLAKDGVDEYNTSSGLIVTNSKGVTDSLQGEADKYKELAFQARLAASGVLEKINADIKQYDISQKIISKKMTATDMQPVYVPTPQDIAGIQATIYEDMANRLENQANDTLANAMVNPANQPQPGESSFTLVQDPTTGKIIKKYSDFISRPGQDPVSFSSSDTIVGMKDIGSMKGGMYITIEGNVYGTDPDEMAEALYDKLRRKISF